LDFVFFCGRAIIASVVTLVL